MYMYVYALILFFLRFNKLGTPILSPSPSWARMGDTAWLVRERGKLGRSVPFPVRLFDMIIKEAQVGESKFTTRQVSTA